MIDYGIFYRRSVGVDRIQQELPVFDIFVSAYNSSDRVGSVFAGVRAKKKIWMMHPEYGFSPIEEPAGYAGVRPSGLDETTQVASLLSEMGDVREKTICIDITGFMRHVLVFLIGKLPYMGIEKFTVLYSEPMAYKEQEDTAFSTRTSGAPRPVRGMGGSVNPGGKDFLIVAVGYEHKLISEVTNQKDGATVYPVFGFPSLSPDMYQQSAVRAAQSGAVSLESDWWGKRRFAPANDPFSTAAVVRDIVAEIDRKDRDGNIYLCPLSTKVQALGFALFWQLEGRKRRATSILLPECVTYSRGTSIGLKRLWKYSIELSKV